MPCLCQLIEQYYAVFCFSVVVNCVALFFALLACLFCVVLCYVVPCRVVVYYCIVSNCIVPCCTVSCCVVLLYRIVFYCTVLCCVVLCRVVPCCAVSCRVVHCRAEQCCPVLSCFVLPRDGQSSTFSDLFFFNQRYHSTSYCYQSHTASRLLECLVTVQVRSSCTALPLFGGM